MQEEGLTLLNLSQIRVMEIAVCFVDSVSDVFVLKFNGVCLYAFEKKKL